MAKRDKRKMTKPVVLTGKEYFEKMYRHLPEFLLVKHRRGGTVVLTLDSESKAKELFEVLKYKFERNDFDSVLPKESADALLGSSMNLAEMNKRIFGFMDPDDVPCSKEAWEAATPKLDPDKNFGVPIVFGTGGDCSGGKYFMNMWNSGQEYKVPMVGMVDQMNESIRLGNYMPPQELLRRLSIRENIIPRATGPRYEPMTPDESFDAGEFFKYDRFDRNK